METEQLPIKVLFVCLGNICRSPTAHGVFFARVDAAELIDQVVVDSAGTAAYHLGKAPDHRTQAEAAARGYDLSGLRARQVTMADFSEFDYVLAMDNQNLQDLRAMWVANDRQGPEPQLFLRYGTDPEVRDVPDPYYGGPAGFAQVLDLCEQGTSGLLAHIQRRLKASDGAGQT